MRNRLTFGGRSGFHEVDHRFDRYALGGVEQEPASLVLVATHLQKPLERGGLE